MHDIVPTWQKVRDLTADRDSWRRLAENQQHLAGQHGKVVKSLKDRIWLLKEKSKAASKRRPSTATVKRLRAELSEAKKQIRRLERITHCKQCRCMDNPRKAYFAERYEAKKNQAG